MDQISSVQMVVVGAFGDENMEGEKSCILTSFIVKDGYIRIKGRVIKFVG